MISSQNIVPGSQKKVCRYRNTLDTSNETETKHEHNGTLALG